MFLYTDPDKRTIFFLLLLSILFFQAACSTKQDIPVTKILARGGSCSLDSVIPSEDGIRRLALIVGVGEYKSPKVPDLLGPPQDAQRFYNLLTDEKGYNFPKQNVCMLLDEQATTADFKAMFQQTLVQRAKAKDVVVVYYAGHGSRVRDINGDESADGWDETWMLHDARSGGVKDLLDDDFNHMLADLYSKTKNITVILDSCNSGSATRGDSDYVARFFDPPPSNNQVTKPNVTEKIIDEKSEWIPESMPGIVVFTAASDGTSALERNGHGIFTDAVLAALSESLHVPTSYSQIARKIRPLVAANSYQIPYFQGELTKTIFGNNRINRPIGWEVISIESTLTIGGTPLPGVGVGAEFRVYPGNIQGADAHNPTKSKATIIMDEITGLKGKAHVVTKTKNAPAIELGDLVILLRPADKSLGIKVSLRSSLQEGGISDELASQIRNVINNNPDAKNAVTITQSRGDYELSVNKAKKIILTGPENKARNSFANAETTVNNLWQHARQKALLQIRSENGSDFIDNETLQVQLVPTKKQSLCADGIWEQAAPNQEQIIPLCHQWNVQVTLSKNSPKPLLIGGTILSTDGSIFGFPVDGRSELLRPGQTMIFDSTLETFMASPPLDVADQLLVFGTQENNPVPWHLLTSPAGMREGGPAKKGLYGALDRYLTVGLRGVSRPLETTDESTWTLSSLSLRVEANSRFLNPSTKSLISDIREYTIKNFDIRPYLPENEGSSLYKVIKKADMLARSSIKDGYSYKQHAWNKQSDAENLKLGIDCSRSIWYVFTRSGLPYNKKNEYLSTSMMVGNNSLMTDEFDRCDDDPEPRLGDILVYRDDKRGDGHVVMVVDPKKRIAWGSHGWDGNSKMLKIEPDTGVEYQLIKYKKDWARWDRKTMMQKACWRYRKFIPKNSTWAQFRGTLGQKMLNSSCNSGTQCKF